MPQTDTDRSARQPDRRLGDRRGDRIEPEPRRGLRDQPPCLRVDCSGCRRPFRLDVDEQWLTEPTELEGTGRAFLGLAPDAPLCPRCLDEVELAGAERMYWARSAR
ncbi:MAG: hypothetical protein ACYDA8_10915 [Deferrisomatales bacterium]